MSEPGQLFIFALDTYIIPHAKKNRYKYSFIYSRQLVALLQELRPMWASWQAVE